MKFNLTTRDLINVGIFTVLYFIVLFATGMIGVAGPYFMIVGWIIGILLNGIVIMLYLARTAKMGALTITGLFVGGIMSVTGHPWFVVLGGIIFGFLGDLIATNFGNADHLERRRGILAYAVFTLWMCTPLLPIFWNAKDYFADIARQMNDQQYATDMQAIFSPTVLILVFIGFFILGLIGGWIGAQAGKKHFSRAGLAR